MDPRDEEAAVAAARWYARLHADDGSAADRSGLERWRRADPAHEAAWRRAVRADHALHAGRADPELAAMIAAASAPSIKRRPWFAYAAAAALALSVGVGTMLSLDRSVPPLAAQPYASATGQVRAVRLADGSAMTLDARSEARVLQTPAERRVTLVAGRALFDVAKNPARPFVVTAGRVQVTALGTHFTVASVPDDGVTVALLEGSVRVDGVGSARTLLPGDVLSVSRGAVTLRRAAAEQEAGWREGRLTFDAAPLSRVVADLNRYSHDRVTIADPGLAARPFSGSLRTRDGVDGLIAALDAYGIAKARREPGGGWVLTPRR